MHFSISELWQLPLSSLDNPFAVLHCGYLAQVVFELHTSLTAFICTATWLIFNMPLMDMPLMVIDLLCILQQSIQSRENWFGGGSWLWGDRRCKRQCFCPQFLLIWIWSQQVFSLEKQLSWCWMNLGGGSRNDCQSLCWWIVGHQYKYLASLEMTFAEYLKVVSFMPVLIKISFQLQRNALLEMMAEKDNGAYKATFHSECAHLNQN